MTQKPDWTDLKAIIVDAEGTSLTEAEKELFSREKPAGFILFKRNCVSREQVKKLVDEMRACVGRDDIPVLIDQEGGSVARLREPAFREYPSAKEFAEMLHTATREEAFEAARLNSYLMALDLAEMGITVNCAPVVDVPSPECHVFLSGSRTYGDCADDVAYLGEAVCRGLLNGGVSPVIKHIPGHGRATVDSHHNLPEVKASMPDLLRTDFKPFKSLSQSDMKTALWAMAAHVVYSELDPDSTATVSKIVTDEIIRKEIGFEGVLIADDISMKALGGTIEERVEKTLAAGMDLTMLCNGSFEERKRALAAAATVTPEAAGRLEAAEQQRQAALKNAAANNNDPQDRLQRRLALLIQKQRKP